jgi:hypothetical protein
VPPEKFVCGSGGWCISPASSFAFKTPKKPLTTNLGKHDIIIVTTKVVIAAGPTVITISGLTMGGITSGQADGFKVIPVLDAMAMVFTETATICGACARCLDTLAPL